MKKKIAIINNPIEFEDFVNREDIEIISVDIKVVEQSFLYQQGFAGVVYYYEIDEAIQALSQIEGKSKIYDIDFNGHILARVQIINNQPTIIASMNGYGNAVDLDKITITPQTK